MEPKFSFFAIFYLCMIMFSLMFTPVNGEKFSLTAISDSVGDLIKNFHVILFFLVISMTVTFEISPTESYEYVFGGVV